LAEDESLAEDKSLAEDIVGYIKIGSSQIARNPTVELDLA
jgi:hypothetical protein